ncbi:LysR family transcriptional regulator [Dongia deserti]|uniref:LysR family transcriptional regulator n=1 Tax=Dongia deserti TaxID=2268030 RepID=UPI0013C53558|nr:LysR family transcriptional regulator [Dongia deserti]
MIRLEAMRVFLAVADCGNIREAAERLGRTPSAISMTLKQIEDRLGSPLFQSDRKHSVTELGRFVLDAGAVLLRDFDRTMDLITAYAESRSGRLRLASVPSVAAMLLPQVLKEFTTARPGLEIELIDTDSFDVRKLVESGQVDVGIASAPRDQAGLDFDPLFTDPFRLVCRAASPLAKRKRPLSWGMLQGYEVIVNEASRPLPSPEFQALAARGRLTVRNVTSLLALVQSGAGITLLPALATANLPPSLRAVPLADRSAMRTVGWLSRQGRIASPVTTAFRAALSAATRQRAKELGLALPTVR